MEQAPERPALEEKHARLVLMLAEQQHERAAVQMLIENPRLTASGRRRNPVHAFVLSAFVPGFGQFYNGEYVKGWIFLGGSFVSLLIGGESLLRLVFAFSGSRVTPSGMEAVFGFLYLLLWIAAIVDAPVRAQKLAESQARGAGLL
jgi:TM2 domain-containing membrane protein YozV